MNTKRLLSMIVLATIFLVPILPIHSIAGSNQTTSVPDTTTNSGPKKKAPSSSKMKKSASPPITMRAPAKKGYCCRNGKLLSGRMTEANCGKQKGNYLATSSESQDYCGYYCKDGKIITVSSKREKRSLKGGRLYNKKQKVQNNCGWCTSSKKVFSVTSKSQCKQKGASFHTKKTDAENKFKELKYKKLKIYCNSKGNTLRTTRQKCLRLKGKVFKTKNLAKISLLREQQKTRTHAIKDPDKRKLLSKRPQKTDIKQALQKPMFVHKGQKEEPVLFHTVEGIEITSPTGGTYSRAPLVMPGGTPGPTPYPSELDISLTITGDSAEESGGPFMYVEPGTTLTVRLRNAVSGFSKNISHPRLGGVRSGDTVSWSWPIPRDVPQGDRYYIYAQAGDAWGESYGFAIDPIPRLYGVHLTLVGSQRVFRPDGEIVFQERYGEGASTPFPPFYNLVCAQNNWLISNHTDPHLRHTYDVESRTATMTISAPLLDNSLCPEGRYYITGTDNARTETFFVRPDGIGETGLQIIEPTGGELFVGNSRQQLKVRVFGRLRGSDNYVIDLLKNGELHQSLYRGYLNCDTDTKVCSLDWAVPEATGVFGRKFKPEELSVYSIRVSVQTAGEGGWDTYRDNSGLFAILEPNVMVVSPQAGETYTFFRSVPIQLRVSGGAKGPFELRLRRIEPRGSYYITADPVTCPTYSAGEAATISIPWIPKFGQYGASSDYQPRAVYKVVYQSITNPAVRGESGAFSLLVPEIRILSPTSGQRLSQSDTLTVTWETDVDLPNPRSVTGLYVELCDDDGCEDIGENQRWSGTVSIPLTSTPRTGLGQGGNMGRDQSFSYPAGEYRLRIGMEDFYNQSEVNFRIE